MNTFTLPTKSQIHLCLNEREARALADLIELHLLRESPGAMCDEADELAEKELTQGLRFRLDNLAEISSGILREMRSCGWPVT